MIERLSFGPSVGFGGALTLRPSDKMIFLSIVLFGVIVFYSF